MIKKKKVASAETDLKKIQMEISEPKKKCNNQNKGLSGWTWQPSGGEREEETVNWKIEQWTLANLINTERK